MASNSFEVVSNDAVTRWGGINTPAPVSEKRKTEEYARGKWHLIYQLFGAEGENEQDAVFAACVAYFWKNGCSPLGDYQNPVTTATGVSVPSSLVVKVTGRLEGDIRKLLRATMKKTFESIKYSPLVKTDTLMRDRAESKGIPRDMCYLLLDALEECEYFDVLETELFAKASSKSIAESNARKFASGVSTASRIDNTVDVGTVEEFAAARGLSQAGQHVVAVGGGGRSAAY